MLRLELIDLFARNEGVEFTHEENTSYPFSYRKQNTHIFKFVFANHEDAFSFVNSLNANLKEKGYRRIPMPTMKYRYKKVNFKMIFHSKSDHEKPLTSHP